MLMRSAERKKSEVRSQKSEYGDRTREVLLLLRFFVKKVLK